MPWPVNRSPHSRHGAVLLQVRRAPSSRMQWSTRLICEPTTCASCQNVGTRLLILFSSSVKTKLQVQVKQKDGAEKTNDLDRYESTVDAINKIVEKEGVSGLYSGMAGALLGVASTNFAYFYWYSVVRTLYMASAKTPKPPGTAIELSLGAAAGAVAQIFTIPVAVITTRQQTQPKGDKKGLIETGREVVESEDGWSGLWRGLKASLILVVNPAITYGAYQRLKEVIFPGKNNLKPWEAFRE